MNTLRESLAYQPVELKFGTSGRRGLVRDLTQLEIYICVRGELDFLLALNPAEGGIRSGSTIYIAYDLRPSSIAFSAADGGRGEIAQAVIAAIQDAGLEVVNFGPIPTPALAAYALQHHSASIMITGSHIPFDRNGYKLNTSVGELLKTHEPLIAAHTAKRREEYYGQEAQESPFNKEGMLLGGHHDLPAQDEAASEAYQIRLTAVFPDALSGLRLLFYEHSTVGRDLVPTLLERLGANVVRKGRSDVFVPIDTENLGLAQLSLMQALFDEEAAKGLAFDAVVSCDGDADRPLLLAINEGKVEFISGDLLGMLAAEYLKPDAVVVPISCNPAIDESPLSSLLRPKTRIGSPFVIAGMGDAIAAGATRVCGWEANGGFLLGTDFAIGGAKLRQLPTRDALLPIVAALLLARQKGLTLPQTVALLPRCFGATALIPNFPREEGRAFVEELSPASAEDTGQSLAELRGRFAPALLGEIQSADYTDGVRMYGAGGEIVHFRPSGNADEFRIYAIARSAARAAELAATAEQSIKAGRASS